MLVTELQSFRARRRALAEMDSDDQLVLDGDYFAHHPRHVLGPEVGEGGGDDDQTAKRRWGFRVVGPVERLLDLVERPMCGACEVVREVIGFPGASQRTARPGMARRLEVSTAGLSEPTMSPLALGLRPNRCVAAHSPQLTTAPQSA